MADNPDLAVTPGAGVPPEYPQPGKPMDVKDHPDNNISSFNQRFPSSVIMGGEGPSMDSAFSGRTLNDVSRTEFALAKGLRAKAKGMSK